ncbi:hypothetical protein THTE_0005 [Thermogutta terrifontis]|uniref:Uncharacterized protein n=1 Tax=Thermogutta terrifontis TaxID=1331910 RepID=A0A286R9H5_9BACT|nr:hypothetical protein THTE_0005 [Thermogutta terrifontis]
MEHPRDLFLRLLFIASPFFRRDVLVTSAVQRSMINSLFPGTTGVPLRSFFSEGPARQVRFFGGTCLSGPPFNAGSSIPFYRGLKSHAKSGAKAPHSMECGDLSPLSGEGFSLRHLAVYGALP